MLNIILDLCQVEEDLTNTRYPILDRALNDARRLLRALRNKKSRYHELTKLQVTLNSAIYGVRIPINQAQISQKPNRQVMHIIKRTKYKIQQKYQERRRKITILSINRITNAKLHPSL